MRTDKKIRLVGIGLTILTIAASAWAVSASAAEKKQLSWGGSQPGGVMYYMVGVAANIFN